MLVCDTILGRTRNECDNALAEKKERKKESRRKTSKGEWRDGIEASRMTMNARLYASPGMHVVNHSYTPHFGRTYRGNENDGRS